MKLHTLLLASALGLVAGSAMAQAMDDPQQAQFGPKLTRAEVQADLEIYRESGLLDLDRGESVDTESPRYQAALKRYNERRASTQYVALLHSFEAKNGEKVAAAKQPDAATTSNQ
ncbi:MAG: DUF4148 domain-containing protein [Pelomonas sp.]|nr:DUF4148 domain-containing protein [Roseateles sp.]